MVGGKEEIDNLILLNADLSGKEVTVLLGIFSTRVDFV